MLSSKVVWKTRPLSDVVSVVSDVITTFKPAQPVLTETTFDFSSQSDFCRIPREPRKHEGILGFQVPQAV